MTSRTATARLQRELRELQKDPPPHIRARPSPSNILEWHYVLDGPIGTPYEGGQYHGKLLFPAEYPFKPPSVIMLTPNGRFEPNKRICMSMSDFHPESWNPLWSVSSILTGLLSFMCESASTAGSIWTTDWRKRALALASAEYNARTPTFRKVFPELVQPLPAADTSHESSQAPRAKQGGEHLADATAKLREPDSILPSGQPEVKGVRTPANNNGVRGSILGASRVPQLLFGLSLAVALAAAVYYHSRDS